MSKVYVVYWSGTGNTKQMAEKIGEGIANGGKEAVVVDVDQMNVEELKEYSVFALGCPSMGVEELEDGSMETFVEEVAKFSQGKKIGLFGSYGWGDGEWMRNWEERVKKAGGEVVLGKGVICQEAPDDDALKECLELGNALALS